MASNEEDTAGSEVTLPPITLTTPNGRPQNAEEWREYWAEVDRRGVKLSSRGDIREAIDEGRA